MKSNEEKKVKRRGRKRKKIPSYFSIEVNEIRSIAMMMNDVDFGKWVKQALDDLSTGCVRPETDERVRSLYEDTKAEMDERYEYKTEWYENKKAEQKAANENEQHQNHQPQRPTPPKPPTQKEPKVNETKKTSDQLVWGQFENVFLTQKQHDDFCVHVGNVNEAKKIIDSLSCKLADGTKTSNNHFATLISWADWQKKNDAEKKQGKETFAEREGRRQIEQLRNCGLLK